MPGTQIVNAQGVTPRHGKLKPHRPVRRMLSYVAMALSAVLVATVGIAGISFWQFSSNLDTVDLSIGTDTEIPQFENQQGAFNVLVVGSDTRQDQGSADNSEHDGELNDVTMLLHVHEDHKGATVISFPRDLLVDFPTCPPLEEGGYEVPPASGVQFNTALERGGLACVAALVESMTGLEIPYVAMITFDGVINMSTAVGGVPVCFAGPINDRRSKLDIPEAGTYDLEGEDALALLRTRYGIGDGSDLSRINSQQIFLSALIRKIQSDEVLGSFTSLYRMAQVATENMTLSTSLNDLQTMVGMANVLRKIPLSTMQFVTYPTQPAGNRLVPDYYTADLMMELVREDRVIPLDPADIGNEETEEPEDSESPSPSEESEEPEPSEDPTGIEGMVDGQNAEDDSCILPYGYTAP